MARAPKQPSKPSPDRLPSKEEIVRFLADAQGKVGTKEIARAFQIKGGASRVELKRLLREMSDQGVLAGNRKHVRQAKHLPPVAIILVTDRTIDGDLTGEPADWDEDGPKPRLLITERPGKRDQADATVGIGDRVLARIARLPPDDPSGCSHTASPIKRLPREKRRQIGIFRAHPKGGGTIEPVDRRELKAWPVHSGNTADAGNGDLVRFDAMRTHRQGAPEARIVEVLGNPRSQQRISLIAVHAHGIPDEFPEPVLDELDRLPELEMAGREDLTKLPLITIDPADARDHDDAVHALPDPDPANTGGFIVTVAIADVAHYVRPGSRLDREAALRGNSVYFPDRVVPMLPEKISNDLCSLREGEPRPCLAVRLVIDRTGAKRRHTFVRAMMRSAAKLSYQQAQNAVDGRPDDKVAPLLKPVLEPLWAAYRLLAAERERRGPLELEVPERRVVLDEDGRVARIIVPERLEAHRLIEEMMIQANVAAAETLEEQRTPCVYRVHDQPSKEKLAALAEFLDTLGLKLPRGTALEPRQLNRVLTDAKVMPAAGLVNEVMLRSQAQAEYSIRNYGHFGLNLRRYAHFTSPIRRYADLLVHRGLVRALKLGAGGLLREDDAVLGDRAKSISEAERRAMAAERETVDRLVAAFLADRVGATFTGRVSGAIRAGLFVRLKDTGADGFIPAETIGADYWRHDEARHALIGDRTGMAFQLGDQVEVRLTEVVPSAGALRFEMVSSGRRLEGGVVHARGGSRRFGRLGAKRRR